MSGWDPAALELMALLPKTARGPKQEGIYALWLTVRTAQDLLLDPPIPERLHRRRVSALESRLSSLTLPAPLRRALASAIVSLKDATPEVAAPVLSQLVAPTREAAGPEAAEVMARAARAAKSALRKS